jgi:hypothetical protein
MPPTTSGARPPTVSASQPRKGPPTGTVPISTTLCSDSTRPCISGLASTCTIAVVAVR